MVDVTPSAACPSPTASTSTVKEAIDQAQLGTTALVATVQDPDGVAVKLTAERWDHIIEPSGHRELAPPQSEVLRAVSHPDERPAAREPDERWYYLADVGPSRWLKVVIRLGEERAFIVTAFPRRKLP